MSNETNLVERESQTHFTDSAIAVTAEAGGQQADAAVSPVRGVSTNLDREAETNPNVRAESSVSQPAGKHWKLLASASALLLTILTVAAVYLVAKRPSTVDQLVILTVPSGADIRLDGKDYGHSPVKLERLAIGTYTITITREGFEPVERVISVSESGLPLEFKLKPIAPSEAVGLPAEEQIRKYQQFAEEAFARGAYGLVYEGSALNWVVLIEYQEPKNAFAAEMRERIQKTAHQSAQSAISRGDLAQGKEIYAFLLDQFPFDEEARVAAARLESQLAARRGKIGELIRKADEAFQAGRLIDPMNVSAYYYSKQVLAIDKENEKARQIRNQIKDRLTAAAEQASARDPDAAIKQLDQAAGLFPEDKRLRARVRDHQATRSIEQEKAPDPDTHRLRGLDEYRRENFADAIQDLEYAAFNGRGTNDVMFALARSYQRIGQLDQAESYFLKLPPTAGDSYRSAIAARGDIALQRGDSAKAVERWREARQLGGSTMYTVGILDDKIERIERPMREKAAEPQPQTIQVRHLHGGLLGGSCGGPLTVSSTGVVYEGKEHQYSYNVAGVGVRIAKDEMTIQFGKDSQRFKAARADAERFRETLVRYQNR